MIVPHDIDLHRTSILLPLADTVLTQANTFRRFVWGSTPCVLGLFCASQALQIVKPKYVLYAAHFPHSTIAYTDMYINNTSNLTAAHSLRIRISEMDGWIAHNANCTRDNDAFDYDVDDVSALFWFCTLRRSLALDSALVHQKKRKHSFHAAVNKLWCLCICVCLCLCMDSRA